MASKTLTEAQHTDICGLKYTLGNLIESNKKNISVINLTWRCRQTLLRISQLTPPLEINGSAEALLEDLGEDLLRLLCLKMPDSWASEILAVSNLICEVTSLERCDTASTEPYEVSLDRADTEEFLSSSSSPGLRRAVPDVCDEPAPLRRCETHPGIYNPQTPEQAAEAFADFFAVPKVAQRGHSFPARYPSQAREGLLDVTDAVQCHPFRRFFR